ncbi:MAG: YidC/Oxa1 family membrane protein insertase [Firmicutes bacterium]|nr:YidC/Oxa1 family membrane protein insertase [Bacillota bacterium]
MKKNKILSIFLVLTIFLTTGCGNDNYIKDNDSKIVINKETGQNLQKDIYCRPSEDTEVYKLYKEYESQLDVKLNDLPKCSDYKINSNKTQSLWQFLFVKPLAYIILKLGYALKSIGLSKSYLGVSVMLIGLLIRIIMLPVHLKTQKQSKKMQEMAPELQRIEKKYANRQDQESMLMKSQETMALYQKYKVSPFLSCLLSLIQLPLFFAFLQAIYKIPAIYEGEIFGWNLGTTPNVGLFTNHQYSFIILIVLIILTTYFSFKYTMSQNKTTSAVPGAESQMKTMLVVMTVFIAFASFSLPTAIALYWIITYAFIIIQTFIMNLIQKRNNKKTNYNKSKNQIKDKLKMKEGMKYGKNK